MIAEDSNDYFYNNGEDLIIPLKIKNMNLGDVIVDRGSLLNQQQKLEIADLVKIVNAAYLVGEEGICLPTMKRTSVEVDRSSNFGA